MSGGFDYQCEAVSQADLTYRSLDKVRVIALYILFREGVADEDRRRLFQHARLSISEQDSVNNLVFLGAKVIKVSYLMICDVHLLMSSRTLVGKPKHLG